MANDKTDKTVQPTEEALTTDVERSAYITIGGTKYELLLTTRATKEIAVRPDRALLKVV